MLDPDVMLLGLHLIKCMTDLGKSISPLESDVLFVACRCHGFGMACVGFTLYDSLGSSIERRALGSLAWMKRFYGFSFSLFFSSGFVCWAGL